MKLAQPLNEREIREVWRMLERYRSIPVVTGILLDKHRPPKKQRQNIEKQASHIRYCIQQAREYFEAAQTVSLSTKPLLLYYSCMSLALVEILFKQSGASSLDGARANNRHHGLLFTQNLNLRDIVAEKLSNLRASPMTDAGVRRGTFELWRRTAEYASTVGEEIVSHTNSPLRTIAQTVLLSGSKITGILDSGLSFLDCLAHLPWMATELHNSKIQTKTVRGMLQSQKTVTDKGAVQLNELIFLTHPTSNENLWNCFDHFYAEPRAWQHIQVHQGKSGGCSVTVKFPQDDLIKLSAPDSIQITANEVGFYPPFGLNEFGMIYVGLFILSNLARYFPDKWIAELENSSELSVLAEAFLSSAQDRMALLCLGELSDKVYVIKPN